MIVCLSCGHGGHYDEILNWFNVSNEDATCPEGCLHRCFYF